MFGELVKNVNPLDCSLRQFDDYLEQGNRISVIKNGTQEDILEDRLYQRLKAKEDG